MSTLNYLIYLKKNTLSTCGENTFFESPNFYQLRKQWLENQFNEKIKQEQRANNHFISSQLNKLATDTPIDVAEKFIASLKTIEPIEETLCCFQLLIDSSKQINFYFPTNALPPNKISLNLQYQGLSHTLNINDISKKNFLQRKIKQNANNFNDIFEITKKLNEIHNQNVLNKQNNVCIKDISYEIINIIIDFKLLPTFKKDILQLIIKEKPGHLLKEINKLALDFKIGKNISFKKDIEFIDEFYEKNLSLSICKNQIQEYLGTILSTELKINNTCEDCT